MKKLLFISVLLMLALSPLLYAPLVEHQQSSRAKDFSSLDDIDLSEFLEELGLSDLDITLESEGSNNEIKEIERSGFWAIWLINIIGLFAIIFPKKIPANVRAFSKHFITIMSIAICAIIVILPLNNFFVNLFNIDGIFGSNLILSHSIVLLTLFGTILAFKKNEHITFAVTDIYAPDKIKPLLAKLSQPIGIIILTAVTYASFGWHRGASFSSTRIFGLPTEEFTKTIPFGFAAITLYYIYKNRSLSTLLLSIITPAVIILFAPAGFSREPLIAISAIIIAAALIGMPVFIALMGLGAVFTFTTDSGSLHNVINECYTILRLQEYAAIPLFTIAGYLLAQSRASERLVDFFRSIFGSLPGGIAIVTALVCAFFTTFTGASGVTILALGPLLYSILKRENYDENFTTGYITGAGSIGLLFPPALPVILYGVQAQIDIRKLYAAAFIPGVILVAAFALYGIKKAPKTDKKKFNPSSTVKSALSCWAELILPLLILWLYFSGTASSIVETASIAVVYLVITQVFIHRDINFKKLSKLTRQSLSISGSILIILAGAKTISAQIIIAEIPQNLSLWAENHIASPYIFLLLLNIGLLLAGAFMDIFSAIIVIVPLIIPISQSFGIEPIHLGLIFLINLQVGYLTPPIGLNLFLSSLTFKKNIITVYRSVLPILILFLVIVLTITYIPALSSIGVDIAEKIGLFNN